MTDHQPPLGLVLITGCDLVLGPVARESVGVDDESGLCSLGGSADAQNWSTAGGLRAMAVSRWATDVVRCRIDCITGHMQVLGRQTLEAAVAGGGGDAVEGGGTASRRAADAIRHLTMPGLPPRSERDTGRGRHKQPRRS